LGAFSTALGAYLLFSGSVHQRLLWLGLGAIAAGLATGVLTIIPPERLAAELAELSPLFENGISRVPGSVESRTAMVASGFRQWAKKPIGLSPHGMRETDEERNTHNDFAAYLFERGYLGFTGLVFLLGGAAARAIYSGLQGDSAHRRLMAALLGVVVVTMVNELAQEFMREREIWLTMAMVMLFARFELQQRQLLKRQNQVVRWPWAVPAADSLVPQL
jgi:O-antigen ligase